MITNVVTPQYRSGHLVKAFVSALGHVRTSLLVLFPQCQACSIIFHLNFYHLSFCKHNSIVTLSHYAKKKKMAKKFIQHFPYHLVERLE